MCTDKHVYINKWSHMSVIFKGSIFHKFALISIIMEKNSLSVAINISVFLNLVYICEILIPTRFIATT